MSAIEILLLAVALAMDCFSISLANTIATPRQAKTTQALRVALLFGAFQGIMPIISWALGVGFRQYIMQYDHWIAFGLLSYIGIKMLIPQKEEQKGETKEHIFNSLHMLLLMSVATSIDALATGIIFIPFGQQIWFAAGAIAAGSFLFSLLGIAIGKCWGARLKINAELLGGIILISIGLKILIEHLLAHH